MDFGALPPEVTSARMYAGPGAGSMVSAAAAWDGLAAELHSTATSYGSVISGLTAGWLGPSSASMAAAAAPYVAWFSSTAAQAEQAASQARAAAAAYETAFAATVPPPVIAANRSQLASLVATNVFGQNTAAIAATEAQYGEMWAKDTAAMFGYAGSSAAATQMTPFSPPPQTTNTAGLATQVAAAAQAAGNSTGTGAQSIVSGIPQLLQQLATASTSYTSTVSGLLNSLTGSSSASSIYSSLFGIVNSGDRFIVPANVTMIYTILGMVQFQKFFHPAGLGGALGGLLPQLGAGLGEAGAMGAAHLGTAASAVSAGVGRAGLVGALSVPPSWASATPTIRMLAAALPGTSLDAAPTVLEAAPAGLFSQMGLAGLAGGALGGTAPRVGAAAARKVTTKPARLERLVAELSQQPGGAALAYRLSRTREPACRAVAETWHPCGACIQRRPPQTHTLPGEIGLTAPHQEYVNRFCRSLSGFALET